MKRTTCRACKEAKFRVILSLGQSPLANSFLKSPAEFEQETCYPLDLYYCDNCGMVQLLDVIDPVVLFRNYLYVTGTSDTMAAHNRQYAADVVALLDMQSGDLVIEIASNDGSLLSCFQEHKVRVLGIEPAANIAAMANAAGIETEDIFFNSQAAISLSNRVGAARAVVANNVLAHVDDTQDFLEGCKSLLATDGLLVIEVPYIGEMLDNLEYDTIYHEHLCYFSLNALRQLCENVNLSIKRIDRIPVHGGSIRMYAGHPAYWGGHSQDVLAQIAAEKAAGIREFTRYLKFGSDVEQNRQALQAMLMGLKSTGKRIAAYGAPAKGNTLLNYCGIGVDLIPFTVDKNPLKCGLYTPGMHLPVRPVSALLEQQPDYVLILAWNFASEIMRQQVEYRRRGGKFILPIPKPVVIE